MSAPPRLLPDEPLPPYTYVPGRSPHPVSDPEGHQFGARPPMPALLVPERWHESRAYLRGIDLFNCAYYWEAHEAWEGLWLAAGRAGTTADFLKGLIRLAAAGVKNAAGKPEGVQSHACRAAELFRAGESEPQGGSLFLGLRRQTLIELAEAICRSGWPASPPLLLPTLPRA